MKHTLLTVGSILFMGNALLFGVPGLKQPEAETVAMHKMSLEDRAMPGSFMAEAMKDNILLTLAYLRGVPVTANPDWDAVRKPFTYTYELKPGEAYAFQHDSLPEFAGSIVKTTDVHFASNEGYKSDGYLVGDGVCHLASLFYWAAKDAGLTAVAPTNHDFMPIPEIPREYGVAIYSQPGEVTTNEKQNLYVKNTDGSPVKFTISYDGHELQVSVVKEPAPITAETQEII